MLGQPTDSCGFGIRVQGVFGEPILLAQGSKGRVPLLLLGRRNGAGGVPDGISAHEAQATLAFGEDGVVELTGRFQMGTHSLGHPRIYRQGQFEHKGRRLALLRHPNALLCHTMEHIFQKHTISVKGIPSSPCSKKGTAIHPRLEKSGAFWPAFVKERPLLLVSSNIYFFVIKYKEEERAIMSL